MSRDHKCPRLECCVACPPRKCDCAPWAQCREPQKKVITYQLPRARTELQRIQSVIGIDRSHLTHETRQPGGRAREPEQIIATQATSDAYRDQILANWREGNTDATQARRDLELVQRQQALVAELNINRLTPRARLAAEAQLREVVRMQNERADSIRLLADSIPLPDSFTMATTTAGTDTITPGNIRRAGAVTYNWLSPASPPSEWTGATFIEGGEDEE